MGLLGKGWNDPQSSANMALAAGLLQGNLGAGLLGANQAYGDTQNNALKQQYMQAQMGEVEAQRRERELKAQQAQMALDRQKAIQAELPRLFGGAGGGLLGGAPQDGPQPMGAGPGAPAGGFDVMRALQLGMDPKMIQEYAGLQDVGRPKATRQMEVDDGKGGKRIALVDDFGREVAGFNGYTAPVQVNRGDRVEFVKPAPGVSMGINMSPSERDSSSRGWATLNETKRHHSSAEATAAATAAAGKIPAGYRLAANGQGLEFIPGGPADPNAAKKAAPTEFQGKSATYGTRAQEADRIITELDGKYSPAAVNSKLAMGSTPIIGGILESVANAALSSSGQKAEQAQRDFVNAVLRQESGAAISAGEFENARKQYFPQPFDSASVKKQKADNRRIAIQGFLNNARTNPATQPTNTGGASGSFDNHDPLGLRK